MSMQKHEEKDEKPVLYNLNLKDYHKDIAKLCDEVGICMKAPTADCRSMWASLRNVYARHTRQEKTYVPIMFKLWPVVNDIFSFRMLLLYTFTRIHSITYSISRVSHLGVTSVLPSSVGASLKSMQVVFAGAILSLTFLHQASNTSKTLLQLTSKCLLDVPWTIMRYGFISSLCWKYMFVKMHLPMGVNTSTQITFSLQN
uniref:MADF domain-containing protein n=1 Tax=Timema cristinae TaxID=61476 RepID=A0A7R9D037_TIMCR|nr:unnamed protein product [Timema cristinae]